MCTPPVPHGASCVAVSPDLLTSTRPPALLSVGSDTGAVSTKSLPASPTDAVEFGCGSTGGTPRMSRSGQTSVSQQLPLVPARVVTAQEVNECMPPPRVVRQSSVPLRQSSQPAIPHDSQSGVLTRRATGDRLRIYSEEGVHQGGASYPSVVAIGQRSIEKLYHSVDWEDPPPGMLSPTSSQGPSRHCSCTSLIGSGSGSAHLRVGSSGGQQSFSSRSKLYTEEGRESHDRLVTELAARVYGQVIEDIEARQANQNPPAGRAYAVTSWCHSGAATVPAPAVARMQPWPPERRVLHRPAQVALIHPASMVAQPLVATSPTKRSGPQIATSPRPLGAVPATSFPTANSCSPIVSQAADVAHSVPQAVAVIVKEAKETKQSPLVSPCIPYQSDGHCASTITSLAAEMFEEASDEISTAAPTLSATSQCLISHAPPQVLASASGARRSGSGNGDTGAAPTPSATVTPRAAALEASIVPPLGDSIDRVTSGEVPPLSSRATQAIASVQARSTRRAVALAERWVSNQAAHPVSASQVTYPCGVSVDLMQLSDACSASPSPGGNDANAPGTPVELRYAQIAWALENGHFAQEALSAYGAFDPEMRGFLAWGGGAVQEFVAAVFRANQLPPPPEAQVVRAYMLFTNGALGAPLDARECLCLVDALVRSKLVRSREIIGVPPSHCGSPLVAGSPVSLIVDNGIPTRNSSSSPRISAEDARPNELLPLDVERWAPEDVGRWAVEELGLPEELGELLVHEEIHGPVLLSLEEEDLERLNVAPFGRRRQLILGIRELVRQQLDAQSCDYEQLPTLPQHNTSRFSASPHDGLGFAERCHGRARPNVSFPEAEVRAALTPSFPSASSPPGFVAKHLRPGPGRLVTSPTSHGTREVMAGAFLQPNVSVPPMVRVLPPRQIEQRASARFISPPIVRQSSIQHQQVGLHSTALLPNGTGALLTTPSMSPRPRSPSPSTLHQLPCQYQSVGLQSVVLPTATEALLTVPSLSARDPSPPPVQLPVQAFSPGLANQQSKRNASGRIEMQSPRTMLQAVPTGTPCVAPPLPKLGLPATSGGSACIPTCPSSRTASPPVPPPTRGASMNIPVYTATRTQKGDPVAPTVPSSMPVATSTRASPQKASNGWLSPRQ